MPRLMGSPAVWRDAIRRIEDLGFDTLSISDHLSAGWVMDPLTALTVASEVTSRIRLLTLVLGNDFRHPVPAPQGVRDPRRAERRAGGDRPGRGLDGQRL